MTDDKLTFMDSLRHYIITNGICELELGDIYNMLYRSLYFGIFRKITYDLESEIAINNLDYDIFLSSLDSTKCIKRYLKDNNITYHFKNNVHYIELKNFQCNFLYSGYKVGYYKKWISLNKMFIDCSFSFTDVVSPLSFSYKIDHLDPQERYKNIRNFKNLNTLLLQPDFQEDISMLVTKSIPKGNVVSKKNVFTSLKFVQRISEEIPAGTCSYIVAPVKKYDDKDYSMPYMEAFNKTVDSLKSNYVINSQRSRSCAVDSYTVSDTFKEWFAHELATNPDFQGNPLQ